MDLEKLRHQARDKETAPEMLAILATSLDKITRQYVASNPSTPDYILEELESDR